MAHVFLSYSNKDHFFAELAVIKLGEAGVTIWRDQGNCVPAQIGVKESNAESQAVKPSW